MATYKPKVISLTKRPAQTFGFYLRVEHGEEGHLIRCLEMGGPAELAGIRDGDRIIRVNGTFTDELSHSVVVDLVRNSGASVAFHILDEASYKQAKAQGVNLSKPQNAPAANGVNTQAPKPKLCYLVKSSSGYGFSLRSVKGQLGLFMTEVIPGSVADQAGVRVNDRLLQVNGESTDESTHDQVVDKIRLAGSSFMFLLVDEETDRHYESKHMAIEARSATAKHLPHKPRVVKMTKGPDGYGFLLKEEPKRTGHFIREIDSGSPAERAGLKDMDRLVAVDGQEVDSCSHDQVVDRIRQSGNDCCLLVVDKDTDQMFEQGKVSPMIFLDDMQIDSNSPPSYTEAINLPAPVQPSTPVQKREEEPKPRLCKMTKTPAGYGFHLNGIQGVYGQYVKVVKGGAAHRAGLEDEDIVLEVNGVNVEQSSHEEAVEIIRNSGSSLEMLVASKSVYEQLKAKEATATRTPPLPQQQPLRETSYAQVHTADVPESGDEEKHDKKAETRPETPTGQARERISSVSSSSSQGSVDERL